MDGNSVPKYYVCTRCSHHWKPRKPDSVPNNCPKCRSTVWMKPFEEKTCVRCGYTWGSTSKNPRRCPQCGTYKWDKAPETYDCLRCGHTWTAKRDWPPKRCPKCRSASWNTEADGARDVEATGSKPYVHHADDAVIGMVLEAYGRGETCTAIAVRTSVPFSIVHGIVRENHPHTKIRI